MPETNAPAIRCFFCHTPLTGGLDTCGPEERPRCVPCHLEHGLIGKDRLLFLSVAEANQMEFPSGYYWDQQRRERHARVISEEGQRG